MTATTHASLVDHLRVISHPDGWGGTQWALMARSREYAGVWETSMYLDAVDPDELDRFADALHAAAASIRSQHATPDEP